MIIVAQVLNRILQTKDFGFIRRNCLDASYFKGFEKEFEFIEEHYNLYSKIPDIHTFLANFPNFEVFRVDEPENYLLDKLYEEYGYHKMAPIIPKLADLVKADSREAYAYLMTELPNLRPHSVCTGTDIIMTAPERYDLYINRSNTPETATIKTGLIELDDIFGGWEYGDELVTIVGRSNQGKCLEKGTLVLMADGTTKKIEDVKVGDRVQSLNRVNTVLALHNGISKGYRIVPNRGGVPFVVSENHILTLYKRKECYNESKGIRTTNGTGEIIDIMIEDFLAKSERFQKNCSLYRPSVDYKEKSLKIPPYILGIWLSEGTHCRAEICSADENIINAWIEFAKSRNLFVSTYSKGGALAIDITTKTKAGSKNRNQVLEDFRAYNLLGNKHIPLDYLTASRTQRLELLAGILDTDGYYGIGHGNNVYELLIKSKQYTDNLVQLVRGLGFKACVGVKRVKGNFVDGSNLKCYYRINITGNLSEIPCKSKPAIKSNSLRNPMLSGFKIEPVEQIEYYGFECDGDHRFLLGDNTLTHNSWILLKFLVEAWKQGKNVGLYSGEMSHVKLGYRFDALFNHFSNKCLTQGIQVDGYQEYVTTISKLPTRFNIITQKEFGGRPTVQKLRNYIECNNIDILGIDQYSLMEDGRANSRDPSRIRLAHISEDLFLLSTEYKIPILGLAQANRDSLKRDSDEAPGLENIKECDDIAHNSSKAIGLRQSSYGLVLDVIKNREGKVGDKLLYSWDIDTGHFSYIPASGDAAAPVIRQQTKQQDKQTFVASVNPF